MSVGVVGHIVALLHDSSGELRGGIDLGANEEKSGMQAALGKFG